MAFRLLLLLLSSFAFAGPCPQDYAHLTHTRLRLAQAPLEELVEATGLSPAQLSYLREHGKAVLGVEEFLEIREGLGQGYLLAKDGVNYTDQIFSSRAGLRHWLDGYDSVGMRMRWKHPDPAYHTPEFLTKITEKEEPIVFLVPPGLFPGETGFTRAEMRWVLEHPDRLRNMIFVFGAYDFLPEEFLNEFSRTRNFDRVRETLAP